MPKEDNKIKIQIQYVEGEKIIDSRTMIIEKGTELNRIIFDGKNKQLIIHYERRQYNHQRV